MNTDKPASTASNQALVGIYGVVSELSSRRSGNTPGSSGVAPELLPGDPLDAVVFGKLVALEAEAPGFLVELVAEFETGINRRLVQLRDAARTHDSEAIAYAAHSIRGSCGTIGALRMASLANHLEYGQPTRPQITALVRQLGTEWEAVRRALDGVRG
jgi:HPt (histidine-containing phosphotransfer) domain-containing protein